MKRPFQHAKTASQPPEDGRQRRGFTLIELLAVIMLLTVLMVAAFPAFRSLQRGNYRHRAIAEADSLAQAAMAYRRLYGQWPLEDQVRGLAHDDTALVVGRDVEPENLSLSNVVAVLTGADSNNNPRAIGFLEWPAERLDTDGTPLDPWGRPYLLVLARAGSSDRQTIIARSEGGLSAIVKTTDPKLKGRSVLIEGPEDAAALSWGDPAFVISDEQPQQELFSWSKR